MNRGEDLSEEAEKEAQIIPLLSKGSLINTREGDGDAKRGTENPKKNEPTPQGLQITANSDNTISGDIPRDASGQTPGGVDQQVKQHKRGEEGEISPGQERDQ